MHEIACDILRLRSLMSIQHITNKEGENNNPQEGGGTTANTRIKEIMVFKDEFVVWLTKYVLDGKMAGEAIVKRGAGPIMMFRTDEEEEISGEEGEMEDQVHGL